MLEIDGASSFGTLDIRLSDMFTNAAEVVWNGKTGASLFFRCNCTSTAFAPNKHGGEKGIHMRFQVDTYELVNNNNTMKYSFSNLLINNNNNNNYYHHSNLSPSNSSLLSSSSSSSSSSFLSNELKLGKEDFDCVTSASDFNNKNQQQQQQDTKEHDSFRSPSPTIDYNTGNYWKHACSSYCRIQLFRLKGAQRKLKTDKSKVERLNPPDLRKRYQPSSKVTILCNNHFDQLYSLMPFNRYLNNNNNNNTNTNINNNNNINNNRTPDNTIDIGNLIENRHLSMDFSGINTNTFYLNNNLNSSLLPTLYNDNNITNNNYSLQPIHVVQQQPQIKLKTELNNSNIISLSANNDNSLKIITSSSSSVSSPISNDDHPNYFLDSNNTYYEQNNINHQHHLHHHHHQHHHSKPAIGSAVNEMSTQQQMSVMINNADETNLNQAYNSGEDLVYTRLKRASSISSLNSNASYGSSNCVNYNYKNNNKFQKITNSSTIQLQKFVNNNSSNNSSPNYSQMHQQQQSTSPVSLTTMIPSNQQQPQLYHQSQSPTTTNPIPTTTSADSTKLIVSSTFTLDNLYSSSNTNLSNNNNDNIFRSKTLPNDCGHKFVQEWLVVNRFNHLLHLFVNYTSNDILRLSKEDMINLCGAPDGIRCFNMAHNILIKPKLTIFVTFQNQTYFSAIFLADWKRTKKLENSKIDNNNNNKESISIKNSTEHHQLNEQMYNSKLEYELFLKIKDILVQTTDEVLNNLNDQSRFLVKFEMPSSTTVSNDQTRELEKNSNIGSINNNNLIKIILIPLA